MAGRDLARAAVGNNKKQNRMNSDTDIVML
jgi:hypothetical protein